MPVFTITLSRAGSIASRLAPLRSDAPFYLFIAAYAAVTAAIAAAVGAERKMLPLSFYAGALHVVPVLLSIVVIVTGILAMGASGSPLQAWRARLSAAAALMPGVLLFLALAVFLGIFSSLKQMLTDMVPFFADPFLAAADRGLHAGVDPWVIAAAMVPTSLVRWVESIYLTTWGFGLAGAALAALFLPAMRPLRRQFVWTFLLVWTVLGNFVAAAQMSGGPVFYRKITGGGQFDPLMQYLAEHTQQAWMHDFLWRAYSGLQPGIVGAGISAFPSIHVATATLTALLAASVGGWIRLVGIAHCALILFGSVLLGWHYAVDGYFSIAATMVIWKLVGSVRRV